MLAMVNPQVTIGVVILVAVSTAASATAGNATASPSAAASNATASPHKNTTASLPPFGTNHAVGEGTGWFFDWKANAAAANYSNWAASRTFYLGDYLSFKTDTGNTVVHTTNSTVYKSCRAGEAASGSSGWKPETAFLSVMLTNEGTNYFFSDARDGEHGRKGMRFEVTVAHGRGLPSVPPFLPAG